MWPMVRLLLDSGADVNVKDREGKTALDLVQKHHYVGIVKMLRKAGARE
jgi:ankyrin repeat protein